jgi:hypothetical protein
MTTKTDKDAITKDAAAQKQPLAAVIDDVMQLIQSFGALLKEETAALKAVDFKTVDKLQDTKRDYARRYHMLVSSLYERSDEILNIDAVRRDGLLTARHGFSAILAENLRALEAAKDSSRRLVSKILDIARRSVVDDRQTHYSNSGRTQSYKTATLSLSVDQKL